MRKMLSPSVSLVKLDLIAASNLDLQVAVALGKFRQDLY